MILVDTGPLVAIGNRNDPNHARCVAVLAGLASQALDSTLPCVTEALYLLAKAGGFSLQQPLWALLLSGDLELVPLSVDQLRLAHSLMEKYRDYPMDFADATLLVAAPSMGVDTIFTLDAGFRVFCLPDGSVLEMIPT